MATIRFLLKGLTERTEKDYPSQTQNVFFRYRPSKNLDLLLQTPYKILSGNWDLENQKWNEAQKVKGAKNQDTKNLNFNIEEFNTKLHDFRSNIERYIETILHLDSDQQKAQIKNYVQTNYFGSRIKIDKPVNLKTVPDKFCDLIDFYIDQRSVADITEDVKPLDNKKIKKYRTLQTVLKRYDKNLNATNINDVWRTDFVSYLNRQNYSANTQVKFIKDIKMLCKYADKDNKISKQVLAWKINANPKNVSEYISFTFDQLSILKMKTMPSDRLDNVRDWLLISCYTSVRVSELLLMSKEKMVHDGEDYYIEVIEKKNQNKTGGLKFVYLLPQVIEILNKRNGDFPKRISEQRYNEYLKEVCQIAGFDKDITWGKTEITKNGKRKVISTEPFYKCISSHSGRATYVTLFKDKLPTEIIQMQTNHHSKAMVDHYDKTDPRTRMLQRAKTVALAHKGLDEFKQVRLKVV